MKTFASQFVMSFLAGVALLACVAATPEQTAGSELRLGTAAVKITPPTGIPMAGYYSRRDSEGVLDDIYAKAAVFDDGKTKAAMVVCDLIGLPVRSPSKHGGLSNRKPVFLPTG